MKFAQILFFVVLGFVAYWVVKLILGVLGIAATIIGNIIPLAIVLGIGYVVYRVVIKRKSLTDNGKLLQ